MERERKDRSANWIIEHHGDSLLRLANIRNFTSWKAAATVLTFPKQVPDGLIDVVFPNRPAADPFLIEVESYPAQDIAKQVLDDAAMVILTRGVLPDIVLVVLSPKGNLTISPQQITSSAHHLSELRLKFHVVNLWTLSAEELLAANDVGLVPWIPLADYAGTPEALMQQCRERIEKLASAHEKPILTAATRVMAEMRYNDQQLLNLVGGQNVTMQKIYDASPSIKLYKADAAREQSRKLILRLLQKRFQSVPTDLAAHLQTIGDQGKLDDLHDVASECPNVDAFRAAMTASA